MKRSSCSYNSFDTHTHTHTSWDINIIVIKVILVGFTVGTPPCSRTKVISIKPQYKGQDSASETYARISTSAAWLSPHLLTLRVPLPHKMAQGGWVDEPMGRQRRVGKRDHAIRRTQLLALADFLPKYASLDHYTMANIWFWMFGKCNKIHEWLCTKD